MENVTFDLLLPGDPGFTLELLKGNAELGVTGGMNFR